MIENLTYEQILSVSNELKKYCDNINQVIEGKEVKEAMEFASKVSSIAVTRKGAIASLPLRSEIK